ncbi:MAG: zf-HC2 domain-containing protein [Candidatus Poribacteria bacterium]|nr:zf-HC2 domain-containing protein [Candidatus Poribacteria bacterium]
MMNHRRIQNQLSAYLDSELNPEERAVVEAHLSICDACAQMMGDFQQNRQWIAALEHEVPPIADRVLAQLPDRGPVRRQFFPSFDELRRWVFRPSTGAAAAAVTVCLIVAFIYFNPTRPPEDALDLYLTVHTEHVAYNPLRSNVTADSLGEDMKTPDTTAEDNTDFLLEVHLGD